MILGEKKRKGRSNQSEDFFLEITMMLGEKRELRDQSFFFIENIKFWKSLPWAPNFEYPPLMVPE